MLLTLAVAALTLGVQPEFPAIEAASRFGEAYDRAPFAERASVTLADTTGRITQFDTLLRRGVFEGVTHTALELPSLRLHHADGELTAERSAGVNPAVVFRVTGVSGHFTQALAPHVPAMPMPQLWRFDDGGRCTDAALGMIEAVAFDAADRTLTARTGSGPLTLTLDAADRILSLDAPLGAGRIRAEYEAIDPGEPASWRIATAGRWVVGRLAQLTPPRSPIVPGIQLGDLNLMTPAYQGVKLSEFQDRERVRQAGPWIVLLFCRADAEAAVFELAEAVASSLWRRAADEIAGLEADDVARYWLGHRTLVVAVSGELEILPEQMARLAERSPRGVPLLIGTEPARTIDRLAAPAALTAVLVDPARTVGAVVPVETAETGVSAVMEAMRSFVRRGDPPSAAETGG